MGIPFRDLVIGGVYLIRDNAQDVEAYVVCESKSGKGYLSPTPTINCVNLYSFGEEKHNFNLYTFSVDKSDVELETEFLELEANFDVCVNTGFSFYKEQFREKFPQHFI